MDLDSQVGKSLALVGVALVALWVFRSKRPSKHFSLAELTTTSTGLSNVPGLAADVEAFDGTPASTLAAWLYDSDLPLNQVIIYWNTGHLHVARDEGPKPYRRDFKQTYDGKNYEAWQPGGRRS